MKNKIIVGIFALLAIVGMSFAWNGAMVHEGERPELSEEVKAEINEAFENKDFEALKAIHEEYGIGRGPMFAGERPELTEEERAKLMELKEEIHEAMESGDFEKVKELRDDMRELLPEGHFGKFGHPMHGKMQGNCQCSGHPDGFGPKAETSE
ncbi:MAG: hypothetical protein ABH983_00205 [Candidatus Micrarchaeota archaeon]